ncbi:hypothetical protein AMATHDRAFT_1836 [Amanita thiersii Skay4041]|uniref:AB hydrolase-1 domain-containing protein n=1 Tax=Amanita thiersii Skay4041 TaxID=703135 RepID=A0A2A9NY53_9AGAR|nr:hypothetical protein AMATHDRAFT_1836 [Amanita thiersii Skay4041]
MPAEPRDLADIPRPRPHRSLSFYFVLFFLVLPFWSVTPLSCAFLLHALTSPFTWPTRALFVIALLEVSFGIYCYCLTSRISNPNSFSHSDLLEIQIAFKRLLKTGLASLPDDGGDEESLDILRPASPDESITQLEPNDPRAIDFRNSLRTWFRGATWSSIRLREMHQWLYWSIYNAEMPDTLSHAQRLVLNDALNHLQKRTGTEILEGSNPQSQPMRLTIDPVKIHWRPLTYYILLTILNRFLRGWFTTRYKAMYDFYDGIEYLIRIPNDWNPSSELRPIIFIHGLGLGLMQYNIFLRHFFTHFTDRPLLVLLQPQISQDFFHPRFLTPLNRQQTVQRLVKLLDKLGWVHLDRKWKSPKNTTKSEQESGRLTGTQSTGVTILSHSNGSYTHAWILKDYSMIVTRSCFVDPVTFCSWEGDVCYNFLYRSCTTGTELLMHYFVGSELGVANLLHRHFDWASNSLWFEEIPNARDPSKTLFFLGGKDSIVNSERVKKYLSSHGVKKGLRYDPEGRHGQALMAGGHGHTMILQWLKDSSITT